MKPSKLQTGKIPKKLLEKYVFSCLGVPSERVLKGPLIGEDAAVIDMGKRVMIAKANPITGAEEKIGWLAVHINANDVAARGATPLWYMSIVLLPNDADESLLEIIMKEQHQACSDLGICIIGGHTEVAPDLGRPIVSGFMLGEAEKRKYITTGGAKVGDKIILTKGVGLEGTGILAADLKDRLNLPDEVLHEAVKLLDLISVVPEAEIASEIGVTSMHTPTEGGVLNGLLEISEASGHGFKIYEKKLPIRPETEKICAALKVDPLKLLSSGSLLIAVSPRKKARLLRELDAAGIQAKMIGEITESERIVVRKDGSDEPVSDVVQDELFRVLDETT